MRPNNVYPVWKTIRRAVQIGFFLLFFFLLVKTAYPLHLKKWVDLFPRLSPVGMFFTIISSRLLVPGLLPAVLLLILTFLLGRFFCGWVCPLGTTIDVSDTFLRGARRGRKTRFNPRALKYYLLLFLFLTSLFGLQITGWLDPLSLVSRSYALLVYPYINLLGTGFFNFLYPIPGINVLSEPLYSSLKTHFFTSSQYLYQGHPLFLLILASILFLGLFSRRWWCRNLCPLGALLAFVSRYSPFKRSVKGECLDCDICLKVCKMGAISGKEREQTLSGECIECLNCVRSCPSARVRFGFSFPRRDLHPAPLDLSRRGFLLGTLSAVVVLPFFSLNYSRRRQYLYLVRPPGSLPEEDFIGKCIRCGLCMTVCPTNGLQPSLWQTGGEGLWTPLLVSRVGYCEYNCNLCTQVCPTGAIEELTLTEKKKRVIGTAYIDENRCIPYTLDKNCLVCEEVCPLPEKAIKFRKDKAKHIPGKTLLYPYVLEDKCIGCGICENKCPVEGRAAIIITAPRYLGKDAQWKPSADVKSEIEK